MPCVPHRRDSDRRALWRAPVRRPTCLRRGRGRTPILRQRPVRARSFFRLRFWEVYHSGEREERVTGSRHGVSFVIAGQKAPTGKRALRAGRAIARSGRPDDKLRAVLMQNELTVIAVFGA